LKQKSFLNIPAITIILCDKKQKCSSHGRQNVLNPSDLPVFQAHLDSMRVKIGIRQNFRHYAGSELSGPLVGFQHNLHSRTDPYVFSVLSVHKFDIIVFLRWM
jgi:hypothetical protein